MIKLLPLFEMNGMIGFHMLEFSFMCIWVWLSFCLIVDMYVFSDNDVMFYASIYVSVCERIDTSVEHVFNEVKM